MTGRLTFLSHFVICLACAGGAFFAWSRGIPQSVYAGDMSMMTSVIAALFVGTALILGRQAWLAGDAPVFLGLDHSGRRIDGRSKLDTDFGYLAAELSLIIGVIGMAMGLAMQGKAIAAGGTAIFAAWATQLSATIAGCIACALILLMTFNLERGIKGR